MTPHVCRLEAASTLPHRATTVQGMHPCKGACMQAARTVVVAGGGHEQLPLRLGGADGRLQRLAVRVEAAVTVERHVRARVQRVLQAAHRVRRVPVTCLISLRALDSTVLLLLTCARRATHKQARHSTPDRHLSGLCAGDACSGAIVHTPSMHACTCEAAPYSS